ncbi:MAG: TIGR03905 family TSCPD domain-containing protein [Bacillota bacterium]|nr:TIGR03905 family TSCPD domain-containing protein [Bacillota bacterium]
MSFKYKTTAVCAPSIDITVEDGIVKDVIFTGGCPGNVLGLSAMVKDHKVEDVIARLEGIICAKKEPNEAKTSCPDQLAQALKAAIQS